MVVVHVRGLRVRHDDGRGSDTASWLRDEGAAGVASIGWMGTARAVDVRRGGVLQIAIAAGGPAIEA
jgi:hypothetical protein